MCCQINLAIAKFDLRHRQMILVVAQFHASNRLINRARVELVRNCLVKARSI